MGPLLAAPLLPPQAQWLLAATKRRHGDSNTLSPFRATMFARPNESGVRATIYTNTHTLQATLAARSSGPLANSSSQFDIMIKWTVRVALNLNGRRRANLSAPIILMV